MTENRTWDAFISHSSSDRRWVAQLASTLADAGLRVWYDAEQLRPGERWQDSVQEALRESAAHVIILGGVEQPDPWNFFELGAAISARRPIIPVVITEDVERSQIPLLLQPFRCLHETSPIKAGEKLAEVLRQTHQVQH